MLGCTGRWNTSLATGLYCTVTHGCLLYRYIQELHVKHQYKGDTLERNMAENKAQLTQKIAEIRPLEMAEALEPLNTSAGLFRGARHRNFLIHTPRLRQYITQYGGQRAFLVQQDAGLIYNFTHSFIMMHAHVAMNHLRNTNLFPNCVHKSHINLDIL